MDIAVNGTYWFGALLGTVGTYVLLQQLDPSLGWRIGFAIGPVLGLVILFIRRHLPESPRWQVMHGRERQAEEPIAHIEREVRETGGELPPVPEDKAIVLKPPAGGPGEGHRGVLRHRAVLRRARSGDLRLAHRHR